MMGAGKTTVGRLVAERLGWRYLDSDDEIERVTGRTVRQIFETDGEAAFRRAETEVLTAALGGPDQAVVSVAGGAVLDAANREAIADAGTVVWLRAPVAILAERAIRGEHRPLLDGDPLGALTALYEQREPIYAGLADLIIDVADIPPEEIAGVIVEAVR